MEPFSRSMCFNAFQKAIKSPIGQAFLTLHNSYDPPLQDSINIMKSLDRLKSGDFSSPFEWVSDVKDRVSAGIRYFGSDSEYAIVISTLLQIIEEQFSLQLKPSQFTTSLTTLISNIRHFCEGAPNDCSSFKAFVAVPEPPPAPQPEHGVVIAPPDTIDRFELRSLIQRLPRDEDVRHVALLVRRHEPTLAAITGKVDVDMKLWSPRTARVVYEYVKTRAMPAVPKPAPVAINPALIPRMRSTPIPASMLNSPLLKAVEIPTAANQLVMKMISTTASIAATSPFLATSPTAGKTQIKFGPSEQPQQPK